MAKERLKSPRARLFIALDLPDSVKAGIEAWGREELNDPALRPVRHDALHVTLAFLGFRAEREIPRLAEIVEGSGGPAPRIELGEPVGKPSLSRARLFALPVVSPAAVTLQAELEGKLASERLYEPEKRPFWPHVTVARVRPQGRESKRPTRLSKPPGGLPQKLLQPFSGVRMTLYLSKLQPQGAQYTPLAQVKLR
ncbi:MAG TPA: RNA 2',3'-cyclic phosphodiesterase [Solirubrobacterales bacterium]|nr:RNA 2',3'-cyclic phosphodiesterase [Solirubrobacterales bacterium]